MIRTPLELVYSNKEQISKYTTESAITNVDNKQLRLLHYLLKKSTRSQQDQYPQR